MRGKWAETRPARELRELNLAFLGLLRRGDPERPGFGLDAASWSQLFRLSAPQLEVVAGMPCLLAGFAGPPFPELSAFAEAKFPDPDISAPEISERGLSDLKLPEAKLPGTKLGVAEAAPRHLHPQPLYSEPAWLPHAGNQAGNQAGTRHHAELRLYVVGLLTWLWQTARQDPLLATLCMGPDRSIMDGLGQMSFGEIQRAGAAATGFIEARFCRHPRLWPDLLRAARTRNRQVVLATQLSVVQLTLLGRRPEFLPARGMLRRPPLRRPEHRRPELRPSELSPSARPPLRTGRRTDSG